VPLNRSGGSLRLDGPPPPGSPAEAARLGEDDELLVVNGKTIDDYGDLEDALRRARPGDAVTLRVRRRGSAAPETVTVAAIEDPRVEIVTVESSGGRVTDAQRRFRDGWLHSTLGDRNAEQGMRH
jgi:predicted metalloprotease with PDZ domain